MLGTTPDVESVMRRLESSNPRRRRRHRAVAHGFEIVERLAHSHHHDVRDQSLFRVAPARRALPIVETVAREHDLARDLAGSKIAHQPLRAGVAERAVERATDLAGNTKRAATGFRNIDAFDLVRPIGRIARKPQQPLAGAVDGNLFGDDLGPREREVLRQFRASSFDSVVMPSKSWAPRT